MRIKRESDRVQVWLSGEIDVVWVEINDRTLATLFSNCPSLVIVDLAEVTFMDSTGLGFLARCVRASQANGGGKAIVVAPNAMIKKTIHAAGLEGSLTIVDSEAEIPYDTVIQDLQRRVDRQEARTEATKAMDV